MAADASVAWLPGAPGPFRTFAILLGAAVRLHRSARSGLGAAFTTGRGPLSGTKRSLRQIILRSSTGHCFDAMKLRALGMGSSKY